MRKTIFIVLCATLAVSICGLLAFSIVKCNYENNLVSTQNANNSEDKSYNNNILNSSLSDNFDNISTENLQNSSFPYNENSNILDSDILPDSSLLDSSLLDSSLLDSSLSSGESSLDVDNSTNSENKDSSSADGNIDINFCDHSYIFVAGVKPTCTKKGSINHYNCPKCGKNFDLNRHFILNIEIVENGHDLVFHKAQSPTCTENGWEEYYTCKNCDYTTKKEIPCLGHHFVGGVCTNCGKVNCESNFSCELCLDKNFNIESKIKNFAQQNLIYFFLKMAIIDL